MANVYRVGSFYDTAYFNTAREADRLKPGGEEPESVDRLDAAEECNHLLKEVEENERKMWKMRQLLEELWSACDVECNTEIGRRVVKFLEDNPLPPATADQRDGQRSYGV